MQLLVHHNGEQLGPFTPEEARGLVQRGHVALEDLAWHEGLPTWVPLKTLLNQAPAISVPAIVPPQAAQPMPVMRPPATATTSGMAIASFVFGVATLFACFLSGVPAIIFGHIARSDIRKSPDRVSGDGLAVAGLVLGYTSLAIPVVIALAIALMLGVMGTTLPKFVEVATAEVSVQQVENAARQVATALRNYASDRGGRYPETLDELVPDYLADRELLRSPLSPDEEVGYLYYGGRTTDP